MRRGHARFAREREEMGKWVVFLSGILGEETLFTLSASAMIFWALSNQEEKKAYNSRPGKRKSFDNKLPVLLSTPCLRTEKGKMYSSHCVVRTHQSEFAIVEGRGKNTKAFVREPFAVSLRCPSAFTHSLG